MSMSEAHLQLNKFTDSISGFVNNWTANLELAVCVWPCPEQEIFVLSLRTCSFRCQRYSRLSITWRLQTIFKRSIYGVNQKMAHFCTP